MLRNCLFFLFSCAPKHIQTWAIMWRAITCKLLHSDPVVSYSRDNIECTTFVLHVLKAQLCFPQGIWHRQERNQTLIGLVQVESHSTLNLNQEVLLLLQAAFQNDCTAFYLFFFPRVIFIRSWKHTSVGQNIVHISTRSEFVHMS